MEDQVHSQVFDLGSDTDDNVDELHCDRENFTDSLTEKEQGAFASLWIRSQVRSEVQKEVKKQLEAALKKNKRYDNYGEKESGSKYKKKKY